MSDNNLICNSCGSLFEFVEAEPNAFIGFLISRSINKPVEPEVTLCMHCYRRAMIRAPDYQLPNYPNIYSYPMKWRAKYLPHGAKIPLRGLSWPKTLDIEISDIRWNQYLNSKSRYEDKFGKIPNEITSQAEMVKSYWLKDLMIVLQISEERNEEVQDYEWWYLENRWITSKKD